MHLAPETSRNNGARGHSYRIVVTLESFIKDYFQDIITPDFSSMGTYDKMWKNPM